MPGHGPKIPTNPCHKSLCAQNMAMSHDITLGLTAYITRVGTTRLLPYIGCVWPHWARWQIHDNTTMAIAKSTNSNANSRPISIGKPRSPSLCKVTCLLASLSFSCMSSTAMMRISTIFRHPSFLTSGFDYTSRDPWMYISSLLV